MAILNKITSALSLFPESSKKKVRSDTDYGLNALKNLSPLRVSGKFSGYQGLSPIQSLQISAVYACVDVISRTLSSLPAFVFMDSESGKEKAIDHPTYDLIKRRPNPDQTPRDFKYMAFSKVLMFGNAYIKISRDNYGRAYRLDILNSTDVKPYKSDGETYYKDYSDGSIYENHEVIHIRGFTLDGLEGFSPLQISSSTVIQARSIDKQALRSATNGNKMDGVIEYPEKLNFEQLQNRLEFVNEYLRDNERFHTAVLDGGSKYKEISATLRDSQFNENKKLWVEEIARLFGVPPHKIGHLEKSTFNNIEQQNIEFVQNVIMPHAVAFEEAMNKDLFTNRERKYFVKFIVRALLRGDLQSQSDFYSAMMDRGVFSINDVRSLEDMNEIENGDVRTIAMNQVDLEAFKAYSEKQSKEEQNG